MTRIIDPLTCDFAKVFEYELFKSDYDDVIYGQISQKN